MEDSESLLWVKDGRFTFKEIVKATDNFSDSYCIGKGGFGNLYQASLLSGQSSCSQEAQMSESSDILSTNRQRFENEIRTLTEVRHRNIIKLNRFCLTKGPI